MFGLVRSAFPKPPNTTNIQTEVLPTPPPPPCPRSKGLALPARPSRWHPPRSPIRPPPPAPSHVQVPRLHPASHQRWAGGHGAPKELTASGPRASSYLQV